MDFGHDERTRELSAQLQSFMDSHIYPAEPVYHEQAVKAAQEGDPWRRPAVVAELKVAARERGLWNLFLPGHSGGAGLRPVISASGAYCRLVSPAPPECPGRNRFHSPRSRAAVFSSATTGGRRHGSPSSAAWAACSWCTGSAG